MPIYEYRCQACGHAFEQLVSSASRRDAASCPQCSSGKVERQLSVFAAHQSGGGGECGMMPGMPRCPQCPGGEASCAL